MCWVTWCDSMCSVCDACLCASRSGCDRLGLSRCSVPVVCVKVCVVLRVGARAGLDGLLWRACAVIGHGRTYQDGTGVRPFEPEIDAPRSVAYRHPRVPDQCRYIVISDLHGPGSFTLIDVKTLDVCGPTHIESHQSHRVRLAQHAAVERATAADYGALGPRLRLVPFVVWLLRRGGSQLPLWPLAAAEHGRRGHHHWRAHHT